jgi:hypothetical protein
MTTQVTLLPKPGWDEELLTARNTDLFDTETVMDTDDEV